MSKTKTFSLGGKALPIDIHTVWVDGDGQQLSVGDGVTRFDFACRGIRFVCRLEQAEGRARLALRGDLGPLPFSAESPAARFGLIRIADAACEALGSAVFRIDGGRLILGSDFDIPVPVTAVGLMSAVTLFLVPLMPYMEIIAIYLRPPLEPCKPGESAVRPEWRKSAVSGRGR